MDLWGLCSVSSHGDGIHQVEGQRLMLSCRFHVVANQHVLGFYRVSGNETFPAQLERSLTSNSDKARKRGLMVSLGLAIYLAFAVSICPNRIQ